MRAVVRRGPVARHVRATNAVLRSVQNLCVSDLNWTSLPMPTVVDFLLEQHLSPQWRGLLRALAAEFESQLSPDELRQLMFRVGARFAESHALPPCESTDDLADALNAHWSGIQWGYVELADEGDYLRIIHYGAPLAAFGGAALAWTPAFLQGCYQAWLDAMGAAELVVAQADVPDEGFVVEFRLARATA